MTAVDARGNTYDELWTLFRSGKTRTHEWRAAQLQGVVAMLDEHESDFLDSLRLDLGKSAFEAATLEVIVTRCEAQAMVGQLRTLMADERVPTPGLLMPGTSFIRREPLGVCLIIGPFK
jgi:aldehyde dehydrogenase (NAD+)